MQTRLFDQLSQPEDFEDYDLGDAVIREYRRAFTPEESLNYLNSLELDIPWRQETLKIAGKVIPVPRLQCWMGDPEAHYGYSGMKLAPEPWHAVVRPIRERVEQITGHRFNCALLNYYRNGQDSVAWHADDEPELGEDPVIASVSFGATRDFQLKPRHDAGAPHHKLPLTDGSLLLMGKGMQNKWLHQIPKSKSVSEPRINLTFRLIS